MLTSAFNNETTEGWPKLFFIEKYRCTRLTWLNTRFSKLKAVHLNQPLPGKNNPLKYRNIQPNLPKYGMNVHVLPLHCTTTLVHKYKIIIHILKQRYIHSTQWHEIGMMEKLNVYRVLYIYWIPLDTNVFSGGRGYKNHPMSVQIMSRLIMLISTFFLILPGIGIMLWPKCVMTMTHYL